MLKKFSLVLIIFLIVLGTSFTRTGFAEPVNSGTVEFTDPMVRKEVAMCLTDPENLFDGTKAISKAEAQTYQPTEEDMLNIKKLTVGPLFDDDYNPVNASGIKGIEKAVNVEYLHLSSLHAPDISLIENLINVKTLYLKSNDISDLSIIKNMSRLSTLNIAGNNLKDLNGIESAHELTSLTAGGNQITDISSVSQLTGIKELYLDDNQISDISPLENLTELKVLILNGNLIKSIDRIGEKPALTSLEINGTYTGPFEAPDESGNVLYDISPLSGMTNLVSLYLQDTVHISDLSPLKDLTKLKTLVLRGNDIKEKSSLSGLTDLTTLYLYKNHVEDISPLASLTKMREFNFAVNNVKDISVLKSMPDLKDIKGYMNDIDDLSSLKDINAEIINFTHNHITDLSFLKDLGETGSAGFYVLDRQEKTLEAEVISEERDNENIVLTVSNPITLADGSKPSINGNESLDPSLGDDFEVGNAVELYNNIVNENNEKGITVKSEADVLKIVIPSEIYEPDMTVNVPFLKLGLLVSDDIPFELYGSFTGTVHLTVKSSEPAEKLYSLTIIKKDTETGKVLNGAEFSLINDMGTEIGSGVTQNDGTLSFSDLKIGKYTIREVKPPSGYALSAKETTVEINGSTDSISVTVENTRELVPEDDEIQKPVDPEKPEKPNEPQIQNETEKPQDKLPDTGSEYNTTLVIEGILLLLVFIFMKLSANKTTHRKNS